VSQEQAITVDSVQLIQRRYVARPAVKCRIMLAIASVESAFM
jgi:hypothetical protein